jgi:hypothetical protein
MLILVKVVRGFKNFFETLHLVSGNGHLSDEAYDAIAVSTGVFVANGLSVIDAGDLVALGLLLYDEGQVIRYFYHFHWERGY